MRAIYIDAKNRVCKELDLQGGEVELAHKLHELCGGFFSAPYRFDNDDILYVFDDLEAMPDYGFSLVGGHQDYYPGSGVIVGTCGEYEVPAKSTLVDILSRITFREKP